MPNGAVKNIKHYPEYRRLKTSSTLPHDNKKLQNRKENKKILPTTYILFIAHSPDKYDGNIQPDEIFLLYKEKLSLFYNTYHNSFLNTDYILVVIQLHEERIDVSGIDSQYCTLEIQMNHAYCW